MQTPEKQEAPSDAVARIDPLTVGAIGILAYMLANVLHEGLGHGGACLLVSQQDPQGMRRPSAVEARAGQAR